MRPAVAWLALVLGSAGCQTNVAGTATGDPSDPSPAPHRPGDRDGDPGSSSDSTLRFYYGPMKPLPAESILYSVAAITGHDFGSWDYTAPDPATSAFADAGNGGAFYRHCRLLGGCMEHRIPLGRTSFVGTAYVLELERVAVAACYDREAFGMFPRGEPPAEALRAEDVIRHQYLAVFGAPPTDEDLDLSTAYFESHLASPEHRDVSAIESAGRGHCRALLTTNRFLYY